MSNSVVPDISDEMIKYLRRTGAMEKFLNWLRKKNAHRVLVLGASGVGKSSFINSLMREEKIIRRSERTDEVKPHDLALESSFIKLIDTPGEILHESKRRVAIRDSMGPQSLGVINVVSFGYHEGVTPRAHAIGKGGKASAEYLQERREVEISALSEWVDHLCGDGGPASWVLTVVTKADLWWLNKDVQDAISHYDRGRYSDIFKNYSAIPHSVKSFSSFSNLFYDEAPMSGYYTDLMRKQDYQSVTQYMLDKALQHGR